MNNPIVRREFVGILRTRKALFAQVGVAVMFVLLVLLGWPSDAQVDLSGTQSRQVFRAFAYGLLASLVLLTPVFPATSIVREKESGTLALLLNSPMGRWSIYFGKLFGALGFALLLLLLSLPAAAACYAMGGLELVGGVLLLYGILALVAVQYATLALLVSSRTGSIDGALRITYGAVLLLSAVSLAPHLFLQGQFGLLSDAAEQLRSLSPIPAVLELLGQGDVGGQGLVATSGAPFRYLVCWALTTVVFAGSTLWRLDYSIFDRPRSAGRITDERSLGTRILRRLLFLVDPQRRKGSIGWFVNPVLVKEFRCRRFGRTHWMLRMVSGCAVLSLALSILTTTGTMDWDVETIGGILVVLQVALIILVTPSLSAGLISGERETGGWRLLLMTPLSAFAIVRGKLLSVAWPMFLILLATLPGYAVMMYIDPGFEPQIQRVLICLLITAGFALIVSAAISSLFSQTAAATTTTYVVLLFVCAATLLVWVARDAPFGHRAVEAVLTVNPMATALAVIRAPGFAEYDLVPANWWFMGWAAAGAALLLLIQTWRLTRPQ